MLPFPTDLKLPKIISKRRPLVVILAVLIFSLVSVFYFVSKSSPAQSDSASLTANTATLYEKKTVNYGIPVLLKIPKIKVNAPIISVGILPNGDMVAPKRPQDVGWYRFGPHPGDSGSAVFDGHYGRWVNGQGSVFDNINKLKKGDKLLVTDKKGTVITFVVRESRSYNPKTDASGVFHSVDGKAHLNLITCEGAWNEALKSYSDRLVIFTDKEI